MQTFLKRQLTASVVEVGGGAENFFGGCELKINKSNYNKPAVPS